MNKKELENPKECTINLITEIKTEDLKILKQLATLREEKKRKEKKVKELKNWDKIHMKENWKITKQKKVKKKELTGDLNGMFQNFKL
jgi:hypothetical protein